MNNQSLKEAGFDLKPVGKSAPTGINDKIVKELMDYTKMQIQIQILNMLLMKLSLVVHNWGKLKMDDKCLMIG